MGDGRLTDALGRTADFTNVILIMTSNLGVKEAASELGFSSQQLNEASIYTQAAERFFSPEFFNRLDRIVPFGALKRDAVEQIASGLILQLFQRQGLARRRCTLHVDDRALTQIIDAGFHPQLGARALKRAIENQLAHPVARHLASFQPSSPTIINILTKNSGAKNSGAKESGGLRVQIQELIGAEPMEGTYRAALDDPEAALDRIENFVDRIEAEISAWRPTGAISLDAVLPQHRRYFALKEQIGNLRRSCDRMRSQIEASSRAASRLSGRSTGKYARVARHPRTFGYLDLEVRQVWKELFAAEDMHAYLQQLSAAVRPPGPGFDDQLLDILRETALLSVLAQNGEETGYHALIMIRHLQKPDYPILSYWMDAYLALCNKQLGMESEYLNRDAPSHLDDWYVIRGWQSSTLAKVEEGTQLFIHGDRIEPVSVKVFSLDPQADAVGTIEHYRAQFGLTNEPIEDAEEWKFDPVIRIHHIHSRLTVDLRSGLLITNPKSLDQLRALLLSGLPLADELME